MDEKGGGTATELLMVISILTSIPAGAYVGVKNRAVEKVCYNNLYQINLFLQMHVMDNGGYPNACLYPENPDKNRYSTKVILKNYGAPSQFFICPSAPEALKKKGLTYIWNDLVTAKHLTKFQMQRIPGL